jgi:hypothetical protein
MRLLISLTNSWAHKFQGRFKRCILGLPLAEDRRDIFAFEWEDPQTARKQ